MPDPILDRGLEPVAVLVAERAAPRAADGSTTIVGIGGAVAVGKSRLAADLGERLGSEHGLGALTVASDGFLLPNHELDRRRLTARKGFPESYDTPAIAAFLVAVRSGAELVDVPVYDHLLYDVLPERRRAPRPQVLLFEGVNVLRFAEQLDLGIYLDAADADVRRWFTERVLRLRLEAAWVPDAYLAPVADLDDAAVSEFAGEVWDAVNAPNLAEHIAPTRAAADVVVVKGSDHAIVEVRTPQRPVRTTP